MSSAVSAQETRAAGEQGHSKYPPVSPMRVFRGSFTNHCTQFSRAPIKASVACTSGAGAVDTLDKTCWRQLPVNYQQKVITHCQQ